MPAVPGGDYVFDPAHGKGFGESARGTELADEMAELDLQPGADVTVLELDADSGWPIIQWTDSTGRSRLTTIEPEVFDADFLAAGDKRP